MNSGMYQIIGLTVNTGSPDYIQKNFLGNENKHVFIVQLETSSQAQFLRLNWSLKSFSHSLLLVLFISCILGGRVVNDFLSCVILL